MDLRDLQDYLTHWRDQELTLSAFVLDFLLVALLALLLGALYVRCGRALSNRRQFAWNFVLIALTTFLVISVIKSSLALSLGLVGALSIVRFRAAIKEPEELAYLFLAVALGLGFGGGKRAITCAALLLVAGLVAGRHLLRPRVAGEGNMHLSVRGSSDLTAAVVATLEEHCRSVSLKRIDTGPDGFEALFAVEFEGFEQLETCRAQLRQAHESVHVTLLDSQALA